MGAGLLYAAWPAVRLALRRRGGARVLRERVFGLAKSPIAVNWTSTRHARWARHGSTRYLWNAEELSAAISYVVSGQGEPMAVCEQAARSRSRFSVDSTTHNTMCELSGPPK